MGTQNPNQTPGQNPNQGTPNPNQQNNPEGTAQNPRNNPNEDRGLEQNDHTYEGENDVTHAPKRTGEPGENDAKNESSASPGQTGNKSEGSQNPSNQPRAGYNQAEHDQSKEKDADETNDSDPRTSKEPGKGNL